MPNWCYNSATFSHNDKSKIDALEEQLKNNGDLFNSLRPMPEELRETTSPNSNEEQVKTLTEKYGAGDWYSWAVNNWGTKWDASIGNWERDEDSIYVNFDTAWAPPIELYNYLTEQGWDINANYNEPGMCFAGIYSDGEDDYYEYSDMTADEVAECLPTELDEAYGISECIRDWEDEDE